MIEAGSAKLGIHDSTSVLLEDSLVSLNGDGNWSLSNSSFELIN
jgi:hypothetical protein